MKVVAVIPCYNEAKYITGVVTETMKYVDQVLVTDDNSTDRTVAYAGFAGAVVTRNQRGDRGYGSNILHGIKVAINHYDADVLVILDGDGQHDPRDVPLLLSPIMDGIADVVTGCRVNGHGMPGYRRLGNVFLTTLCNAGAKQALPDALSGFWAIKSPAMPELTERRWGMALELLIKTRASGYKLAGIPVHPIYHTNYADNSTTSPAKLGYALLKTIIKWRLKCEVLKRG